MTTQPIDIDEVLNIFNNDIIFYSKKIYCLGFPRYTDDILFSLYNDLPKFKAFLDNIRNLFDNANDVQIHIYNNYLTLLNYLTYYKSTRCIDKKDSYGLFLELIGNLYKKIGSIEVAKEYYYKACNNFKNANAACLYAYYTRGEDNDIAISYFIKAIELGYPNKTYAELHIAICYQLQDKYDMMTIYYNKVIDTNNNTLKYYAMYSIANHYNKHNINIELMQEYCVKIMFSGEYPYCIFAKNLLRAHFNNEFAYNIYINRYINPVKMLILCMSNKKRNLFLPDEIINQIYNVYKPS